MLEYKEQADGSLTFNGMTIPAVDGNRHYTEFLLLEEAGEATLIKWAGSAEQIAADKAAAVQEWKTSRATAVESITVEVDGMVFDGDETSQTRMARAVTAADNDTDDARDTDDDGAADATDVATGTRPPFSSSSSSSFLIPPSPPPPPIPLSRFAWHF